MSRFVCIALATIAGGVAVATVYRALGLDGFDGEIVKLGLMIVGMLLVSLADRELFWALPPKHERRR
jgi:hypothetical protein